MKNFDYSKIESMPENEFNSKRLKLEDVRENPAYRRAGEKELNEVEDFLEVQRGTLKDIEFHLEKGTCSNCGRELDFEDFVRTSVKDGGHSKSGVLHTLLGNKRVLNKPHQIRCSACDTVKVAGSHYAAVLYGCGTSSQLA